ncbi:reverse transcriptase domain-containing protein [Tanacetum coccineum]
MDDEPMWAADHVVATTLGSAIPFLKLQTNLPLRKTVAFADEDSSNSNTDKIMTRMDAMTMKIDAQYKEFQSRSKQPNPNNNDDDTPMYHEEEAKFMQTFRRTYFYNDYRDRDSNRYNWHSSGRNDYNRDNYQSNSDDKPDLQKQLSDFINAQHWANYFVKDTYMDLKTCSSSKSYQPPQARNEQVNAVFTRSGKSYDPPINPNDQPNDSKNPVNYDSDDEDEEPTPQPNSKNPKPVKETTLPKPYKPKITYPQCLRIEKIEAQYGKFFDMIQVVRINVPLVDVLAGMPNYGKFLKELVSNKHKLEQISATFLSDKSVALIQNKVPPKVGDPGSFFIPCNFNKAFSCDALADLGARINFMPYTLYAKLSLETLKPTKMSVRLADMSFQYPIGIAKNMLVEVGKFTFLVDFVILEMEEDSKVPLILGRPFLHTADVVIRVKQKQLNLGVGTERMTFHMDFSMKHSYSNDDTCFSIDVIDEILEEYFDAFLDEENSKSESDTEEPPFEKITFNIDYKIKTSLEEPPTDLELKPLPDYLEYVFLEEPSFLPVIISSQLSKENKNKLVFVLKNHKQAFAWKITDIPGIIKDKKGTENVAADHLSRIKKNEASDDSDVDDNFSRETLMEITTKDELWFVDFANYLVGDVIPKGMTYQQKNKFFADLKNYFWEDPYLFKVCSDGMIRRRVSGPETHTILDQCHNGPTGGHYGPNTTSKKVLDSGFYWPTIIKEVHTLVRLCEARKKTRNISKRDEMPLNIIQRARRSLLKAIDSNSTMKKIMTQEKNSLPSIPKNEPGNGYLTKKTKNQEKKRSKTGHIVHVGNPSPFPKHYLMAEIVSKEAQKKSKAGFALDSPHTTTHLVLFSPRTQLQDEDFVAINKPICKAL